MAQSTVVPYGRWAAHDPAAQRYRRAHCVWEHDATLWSTPLLDEGSTATCHAVPSRLTATWAALPLHCFPHSTIVRVRRNLCRTAHVTSAIAMPADSYALHRDEPPVSCGNVGIPNLQHPACFASAAGVPQHPLPDAYKKL
jgi:hypothetical protein